MSANFFVSKRRQPKPLRKEIAQKRPSSPLYAQSPPDYNDHAGGSAMIESTPRDDYSEFIGRIRQGDEVAAEELVRRYEAEIRLEVRGWLRLRNPALRRVFDSMDICQSVLASFFARAAMGDFDLDEPSAVDSPPRRYGAEEGGRAGAASPATTPRRAEGRRFRPGSGGRRVHVGKPQPSGLGSRVAPEIPGTDERRGASDRRTKGERPRLGRRCHGTRRHAGRPTEATRPAVAASKRISASGRALD